MLSHALDKYTHTHLFYSFFLLLVKLKKNKKMKKCMKIREIEKEEKNGREWFGWLVRTHIEVRKKVKLDKKNEKEKKSR